jgi:HEAT repeat protein
MRNVDRVLVIVVVLGVIGFLVAQNRSVRDLKKQVQGIETRLGELDVDAEEPAEVERPRQFASADNAALLRRVGDLEKIVMHALATNRTEDLQAKVIAPGTTDAEKLNALRLLRRNKGLSDEVVQHALDWLQSAQDPGLRREILQQIDGATNAAARQVLLTMATSEADPRVRQEAIENLRHLAGDPEVEAKLISLLNDPDENIRERAEDALRDGPITPGRIANAQRQILDPNISVDQKLTALDILEKGGGDVSSSVAAMLQLAQTTQDPATRAKIFRAQDDFNDPQLVQPFVTALQDPDPTVRRRALSGLRRFKGDPNVRKWLEFVAASDADPRVQREAQRALR